VAAINVVPERNSWRIYEGQQAALSNITYERGLVYELDINGGRVLAQKEMPFKGDFGDLVFIEGFLYQGLFHESKMYKISTEKETFGNIVTTLPLPTHND
jgi:hypothetical protein